MNGIMARRAVEVAGGVLLAIVIGHAAALQAGHAIVTHWQPIMAAWR